MLGAATVERNMQRPITPADLWNLYRVAQPEHVPDSTSAVVEVTDYHNEGKASSVLHLVDRAGDTTQITNRAINASAPSPSPDGSTIAFLGSTEDVDEKQIFTISTAGGEAAKVTDFPLGARALVWIPGRNAVVAAVPLYRGHLTVEETAAEKDARTDKTPPIVTEDRHYRFWKRWLAGEAIDHLTFLSTKADFFVPAALENQITAETAPMLDVKLVVEAANGPTDPDGERILRERGIDVLPDILCNSGGVIVSYFEWLQNKRSEYWDLEEVDQKLHRKLMKSFDSAREAAREFDVDWRTGAYAVALRHLEHVYTERGIFP